MPEQTTPPGVERRARDLAASDGGTATSQWEFLTEAERNVYRSRAAGQLHDLEALCFHCVPDHVLSAALAGLWHPDIEMGAPVERCPNTTDARDA